MSDAREEAAIARDALVRDKKKPKQQTTLLTKWNIVQYKKMMGIPEQANIPNSLHLHELLDANGVTSRFTTLA